MWSKSDHLPRKVPGMPQEAQGSPKRGPRETRERPREARKGLGGAKKTAKRDPKSAQRAPERARLEPKWRQWRTKRQRITVLAWSSRRETTNMQNYLRKYSQIEIRKNYKIDPPPREIGRPPIQWSQWALRLRFFGSSHFSWASREKTESLNGAYWICENILS